MLPLPALFKSGSPPTLRDFNNFLLFLCRNRRFKAAIHFLSQLTSNRINAESQTLTIFAKSLLKETKFEEAVDFLKALPPEFGIVPRSRLFDSLVQRVCAVNHDPERGFSLLEDFLKIDGFMPSSRTFCALIYCFSRLGEMDRVIDLLELMSDDKLKYPFDNYVCSSVISGFSRIGEFQLAIRFYENAVESGNLVPNVVTCTAAVNAYYKLGRIDRVSSLAAWMEDNDLPFDVVFYSNWMYACFSERLIREVFESFRAMVDRKIKLDGFSYTIVIDGFSKEGDVEKAVGFLYRMKRDGVEPNVVTYTTIILGFCKKGKVDEAFAIFGMLKRLGIEADEFTYAVLIGGVCRKGDFNLVFQLLDEMVKKGVKPGVVTYNTIVNGLCKAGRTMEADDFAKGIDGDAVTYTTLLLGYLREGSTSGVLETKRRLEESGVNMDVIMCNVLIKAMLMVGLFDDAFSIYEGLTGMNISPNSVTYYTLIHGYCEAGRIHEALEIFDDFRKVSNASAACYSYIILGLCRTGLLDMAIDVLIENVSKGLPLDRAIYMELIQAVLDNKGSEGVLQMIYRVEHIGPQALNDICNNSVPFLCKMGFPEASCSILLLMKRKGLELAGVCYYSMLKQLLFEGRTPLACLILPSFVKSYGLFDIEVSKTIVYYLSFRDVKKALIFLSTVNAKERTLTIPITLFKTLRNNDRILDAYELLMGAEESIPNMDVVDYSIMIDALCKSRHIDKALNLCSLAAKKGIALNIVTYNIVINGLCRHGCLVEAFRLYDSLERIGIRPTEVTYGTLIDALVREGLLHDAMMLLERMFLMDLSPTTRIYNSLINGYCKSSQLEEGMKLFRDLEARGLEPDGFTISALINGYCQKGDMEGALKLFSEFMSNGLLPNFQGFMYLVRGLCAKGRMEESRSILREMLRTRSIIELLGRVDLEIKSDSVENLLVFLCERGRINEAVSLLDEVESLLFSTRRNSSSCYALDQHVPEMSAKQMPSTVLNDSDKVENILTPCAAEDGRTQLLNDFDSFYSIIRSLCIKGELAKAHRLTKLLTGL